MNPTQEQLDRYEQDLKRHKDRILIRRFELDRTLEYLKSINPEKESWTLDEIRKIISAEISMSDSCDEPNRPGYYRANND